MDSWCGLRSDWTWGRELYCVLAPVERLKMVMLITERYHPDVCQGSLDKARLLLHESELLKTWHHLPPHSSLFLCLTPPHSHSHPPLCPLIFLRNMTSPGVKSSSSSRVGPQVAALAHDGSCHVSTHRQDEVILLQKLNSFMVLQLFNLLLLRLQARFNMNNKV